MNLLQKKRTGRSIISLCDRLSDWSSLNFSGCRSVSCWNFWISEYLCFSRSIFHQLLHYHFLFLEEPERQVKPMLSPFTNFGKWLKDSFLDPYFDLFLRYKNHLIILLLVMFTYRLSDIFLGPMAMPFYQFLGFTKSEVATYTKSLRSFHDDCRRFIWGLVNS